MSENQLIYAKPEQVDIKQMTSWLSGNQRLINDPPARISRTYLDSFDWRLYKAGTVLEASVCPVGYQLTWRKLRSGEILFKLNVKRLPRFATDLSSPGFRKALQSILSIRALQEIVTVVGKSHGLRQVDEDEKTVFRLELRDEAIARESHPDCPELPDAIHLFPFRGFEKEATLAITRLQGNNRLSGIAEDPLLSACGYIGAVPGEYSNKPAFLLDPRQPVYDALRTILRALLENMEANVQGVRTDLDPEFLNDFLLAIARSRCLLSQFQDVFPEQGLTIIDHDFNWLIDTATPVRNLDLFLLHFDQYRSRLPEWYKGNISPLEQFLKKEKNKEHFKMRTAYESPRFDRLFNTWRRMLDQRPDAKALPGKAEQPVQRAVRERIGKAFETVLGKAKSIDTDIPASELLEFRQLCKTLDYHLEIFYSLFPGKAYAKARGDLDDMLEFLHRYFELDLQQHALRVFTGQMKSMQRVMPSSLEAINLLVNDLGADCDNLRESLPKQLKTFCGEKVQKHFRSML